MPSAVAPSSIVGRIRFGRIQFVQIRSAPLEVEITRSSDIPYFNLTCGLEIKAHNHPPYLNLHISIRTVRPARPVCGCQGRLSGPPVRLVCSVRRPRTHPSPATPSDTSRASPPALCIFGFSPRSHLRKMYKLHRIIPPAERRPPTGRPAKRPVRCPVR